MSLNFFSTLAMLAMSCEVQAACYDYEYGESCCHTSSSDGLLLDRGLQCTGNIPIF